MTIIQIGVNGKQVNVHVTKGEVDTPGGVIPAFFTRIRQGAIVLRGVSDSDQFTAISDIVNALKYKK